MENTTPTPKPQNEGYWKNVKDLALTGFSVVIGDPEAMKTMVDILANATYKGMEHLNLKDQEKEEIKRRIETSIDQGADSVIKVLTSFQESSAASSKALRQKYGRKKS